MVASVSPAVTVKAEACLLRFFRSTQLGGKMDVGRALMAGESVSKRCLPSGPASTFREGVGEGATWGGKGNAELGRFTAGGAVSYTHLTLPTIFAL